MRWNSVTTSGAIINIFWTVTGEWDEIESVRPSVTTYTHWRCRPGITYYYRLQVISNGIYSPWSAEVTATPPQGIPNLNVVDRLIANFGKPYSEAY